MWHINRRLWESHKADLVASHKGIAPVRECIGFAEMVNHGWLTTERSVQITDWGAGARIIVDFDGRPFERKAKGTSARSLVCDRKNRKQNEASSCPSRCRWR
jgi:hypothetical protein